MKLRSNQETILNALKSNNKGIISCPTGGGKTLCFIEDSRRFLKPGNVILVVAPQLMLSEQLFNEFDKHLNDVDFMYRQICSEPKTFQRNRNNLNFRVIPPLPSTTVVEEIKDTYRISQKVNKPLILFVTYDSLDRIIDSKIPVSVAYYDEAHNATSSSNFKKVESLSKKCKYNYFFTATPRYSESRSPNSSGMDNVNVYGEIIANIKFTDLVEQGSIVRPHIHLMKSDANHNKMNETSVNMETIKEVIEHYETNHNDTKAHKILFCAQGTKSIKDLLDGGLQQLADSKGYKVLTIDSVNQGYIDSKKKIAKSQFIETLNALGQDPEQKLIVLHYSMLGEGIDVKSFTGVVFLRNTLSSIFATQSMGRVIRSSPGKKYGIVTVVQHESSTKESEELIRNIVHTLIRQGVPVSEIFAEVSGKGKIKDTVEDVDMDKLNRSINTYAIQFEHNNILKELLELPVSEIVL